MFRKSVMIILALSLVSLTAAGQEAKSDAGLSQWLKAIQKKISAILPKKDVTLSTGVAGIRGAKQESQAKLYWKGKKGEETVTEEELTKFKACIELADQGDRTGAARELETFMKQYPDCPLIPDAKKTLDLVKADEKQ